MSIASKVTVTFWQWGVEATPKLGRARTSEVEIPSEKALVDCALIYTP